MRVVKIASYYKSAVNYLLEQHKEIVSLPYEEQLEAILDFGLGWANFYQKAFNRLGVEFHEVISNIPSLTKAWQKQYNIPVRSRLDFVMENIKLIKPDVVWFQDSISFPADFIKAVGNLPYVKLVIGNSCSPFNEEQIRTFKIFDFITTCSQYFEEQFNRYGVKTLKLLHAFDPDILRKINNVPKKYAVVFTGSIIGQKGYHQERKLLLKEIINSGIDIEIFANIDNTSFVEVWKKRILYASVKTIDRIAPLKKALSNTQLYRKALFINEWVKFNRLPGSLKPHIKPPVYGLDMFKVLAQSRITLNNHGEVVHGIAANMRMFEATGMGSVLVTENFPNMPGLFEPEKEVILYDSPSDAAAKIRWLLDHPQQLQNIAQAGQERTLRDHTYDNRAIALKQKIEQLL